jgi:ATP/maltotriose-dependent transcriptional regulator MalT
MLLPAESALAAAQHQLSALTGAGRLPGMARKARRELAAARARPQEMVERPSPAELSILQLLASDLSQREIGGELFLSLNTVKSHSRHLYAKLGVHSREEAIEKAYVLGLVESSEPPSATRPA